MTAAIDRSRAIHHARRRAAQAIRSRLRLPPRRTLSEWADEYRVLSAESTAEPGPWSTDRVPYLREIMDAISGREHAEITIVKCSQSGGTEAINNAVGYFIDQEPSPMLVIQPNVKPMAEAWSKDRLAPMLRDTPRLRDKVKDPRSRESGNTVLHKVFPGGYVTVVGANSPAGLASRPIRIVLADELDRWTTSAGTEGDPLSLARRRTITYRHRKKIVKVSTPGNEGESRIEKEWEQSDQRHFYVPCPHCGHEQPLEWRDTEAKPRITNGRGQYRLVWEKTGDGDEATHRPETAAYQCRACSELIEESHKPLMLARGRWVKHNPGSELAGWHISGLLSPWVRWREIAAEWLLVKDDPEQRKTFFNTLLGLLYSDEGEIPDADALASRREAYAADVPMGAALLTAAIDVQSDRLEIEVRGWGADEESWHIRLERLFGDPEEGEVWERAQAVLAWSWRHESGVELHIRACMVDSGFSTDAVYRFVKPRQLAGVYAAKGVDDAKAPISRAARANRDGVKVFTINPVALKDVLFARLRRRKLGPGYLHFGPHEKTGTDDGFFLQYGAEKRVVEYVKSRMKVRYVNPSKKRNEAIDLYCLNLAALRSLGLSVARDLGKQAARLRELAAKRSAEADPGAPSAPKPPDPAVKRRPPRRPWRDRW